MYNRYTVWAMERFFKRVLAYLIILPIVATIWPVTTIGDWLCRQYYKYREW